MVTWVAAVCLCLHVFSPYVDINHQGLGSTLPLIISAKTLFPNKIPLTGSGSEHFSMSFG